MFFRSKKDKQETESAPPPFANAVVPPAQGRAPFAVPSSAPPAGKPAPAPQMAKASAAAAPAKAAASLPRLPARSPGKKDVVKVLGQLSALMMRTPGYAELKLADLVWFAVPALQHGQFAVAEARKKDAKESAPVGAVLWAMVSDAIDKRLSADASAMVKLEAKDWKSGSNPWFLCVIGGDKVAEALMQQALEKSINGTTAKARVLGADGRVAIKAVTLKKPH